MLRPNIRFQLLRKSTRFWWIYSRKSHLYTFSAICAQVITFFLLIRCDDVSHRIFIVFLTTPPPEQTMRVYVAVLMYENIKITLTS